MSVPPKLTCLCVLSCVLACRPGSIKGGNTAPDDTGSSTDDTGSSTDDTGSTDQARWTFLVYMNGDNDLESYVTKDLNELEGGGSGDGVHVLVQADRIPGYDDSDGNWTGGRRYYIEADDSNEVTSTVLEDLGEIDMGVPETLSDFLLWAHENYPAERMALVMWNHGDGWSVAPSTDGSVPPPYISWDMTEGTWMSIAAGDLTAGLDAIVEERGPLDLVAFDACNMGSWEVGHSLREHVQYMAGSETVVGMSGYQYDLVLEGLREQDWTGAELADQMAWSSADFNGEWTHVALDLAGMDGLATAVDELAAAVLADESRQDLFLDARNTAGAADLSDAWHDYMVDLHDLGQVLSGLDEATLVERGAAIDQAMEDSVVSFYSSSPFEWAGGLSIFAETDWDYLEEYAEGEGATWSQQTQWDDLLVELAGEPSL